VTSPVAVKNLPLSARLDFDPTAYGNDDAWAHPQLGKAAMPQARQAGSARAVTVENPTLAGISDFPDSLGDHLAKIIKL